MTIINAGDSEARYVYGLSDHPQAAMNVIGHHWPSDVSTIEQHAEALYDAWMTAWNAQMDTHWFIGGVLVRGRPIGGGELQEGQHSEISPGLRASEEQSPSNALLIHKRTGLAGRRNRGRIFLPGVLGEASVDERGRLVAATLTGRQGQADGWLTALDTQNREMRILHNTEPSASTLVTSLVVDHVIGTQRRRLGRAFF